MTLLEAAKKILDVLGDGFFVYHDDDSIAHCPECNSIGFEMYTSNAKPHDERCEFGKALVALREAVIANNPAINSPTLAEVEEIAKETRRVVEA